MNRRSKKCGMPNAKFAVKVLSFELLHYVALAPSVKQPLLVEIGNTQERPEMMSDEVLVNLAAKQMKSARCPECGSPAVAMGTFGGPIYAECKDGHKWEQDTSGNGPAEAIEDIRRDLAAL